MVTEIAIFTALAGKEEELGRAIVRGLDVIRQHPECISSQVERSIEKPEQYILINIWTSLEAHIKDFRSGPLFPQWRSHINGLFEANPTVFHCQPF
ncbi:MAG TPA: antibiotic biosynthesis monooxygenase family protein [Ktedonobacteraceae bacterium]